MMLMRLLPIIQIGHKLIISIILLIGMSACCRFLACEDVIGERINVLFENDTYNSIKLKRNATYDDSVIYEIDAREKFFAIKNFSIEDSDSRNGIESIALKSEKFELYVSDELVRTWEGPGGSYGDTLNSPFNYDSWEYDAIQDAIIFTITNDDIVSE